MPCRVVHSSVEERARLSSQLWPGMCLRYPGDTTVQGMTWWASCMRSSLAHWLQDDWTKACSHLQLTSGLQQTALQTLWSYLSGPLQTLWPFLLWSLPPACATHAFGFPTGILHQPDFWKSTSPSKKMLHSCTLGSVALKEPRCVAKFLLCACDEFALYPWNILSVSATGKPKRQRPM